MKEAEQRMKGETRGANCTAPRFYTGGSRVLKMPAASTTNKTKSSSWQKILNPIF
jgi:hypothetical protein